MTIQQKIIELITEKFPGIRAGKLDVDLPLEQQGIDSLDMSNLLFALEAQFGRRIATSQVSSLRSVRDMTEFFEPAQDLNK